MRIKLECVVLGITRAEESIRAGKLPDALGYLRDAKQDAQAALERCEPSPADAALDRLAAGLIADLEPEIAAALKPCSRREENS